MSDKPEALRLADELDSGYAGYAYQIDAAAELRRLHSLNAELVEARAQLEAELAEQARLNGMGSEREARLLAANAALLEAFKHAAECVQTNYLPDKMGRDWDDVIAKASLRSAAQQASDIPRAVEDSQGGKL